MGRRKSTPQAAPSTPAEAVALIHRYLVLDHSIAKTAADADVSIADIQATRDKAIQPLETELKDIFLQLRAWWAVGGAELAKGNKSIELAGAKLGHRMTPGKLKNPKGIRKDADAVPLIEAIVADFPGAKALLRFTTEMDKKAIVKVLGIDEDAIVALLGNATAVGPVVERVIEAGFTVSQGDEFFIDRAAPKEPAPEIVDAPTPAIAEARS